MWRAFFFAVGTMLVIVGIECLLIDSATLASDRLAPEPVNYSWFQQPEPMQLSSDRVVRPPDWIPWSLIASGAVVILYAMTLPRRWGAKAGE